MSHSILFTQQRFVGTSQIWFQTTLSENLEHIQIYIRHGVITAVSCILQEKGRPLSLRDQGRLSGDSKPFILALKNEQTWSRSSWKWEEARKKGKSIPWRRHCLGKTTKPGGTWCRRRAGQWSQSVLSLEAGLLGHAQDEERKGERAQIMEDLCRSC